MSKLSQLAIDCGFENTPEMIRESMLDSVVPGICTSRDCDYSTDVEPDCRDGWCEVCESNTVKSCLVIAGVI